MIAYFRRQLRTFCGKFSCESKFRLHILAFVEKRKVATRRPPWYHRLMASNNHWGFTGTLFHRIVVLFCMASFLLLPGPLFGAEKNGRKVVRIAYQEYNRQMMVDENNHPLSGYAYDYTQTIATYAGWDIHYVPCASFFDSVKLLLAGNVDLIYEISYTEERARDMLFPDEPMGVEYYYLYSSAENTSITPDDYASMNGKTVGVTGGTILTNLLKQWSDKKNVTFNIVEYEDIPKKEADLYAGKIDLDLELSMVAKRNLSAVEKVGSSAYYLVANKNRPDLIADINSATEKVLSNDLFYFSRLQERYFSDTVLSRNLTLDEKKWLANHKVLRVGYFDNYLPFSTKDECGRPMGAVIEAIREIIRQLKLEDSLTVEFICYDNQKEGYRAVESGEIDLMLPVYISNSVKRDYRIIGGKSLATFVSELAFLNDYGEGKDKRIGVNRNNLMQYYYSRDCYPDSDIVFYDDIRGCLDGLLDGTSDGTFLNGARAEALLKPAKYHSLRAVRAKSDFQLHMAFAEDNLGLMLLMNRGLTVLDPDFINKASYSYVGEIYSFSAMYFLQDHLLPVIVTIAIIVALIAALVVYWISNRKLSEINRKLTANSETIEQQRKQEFELRKQLERKQGELEDALRMAQSANRAKTTFLRNISHDIRTPMNAIIGFTGLAASHADDGERVREYLETIAQSSDHLLSLINDVLDMSRIESGKMTLNEKPESLPDILHALRDIVHADMAAKQHTFSIDAVDVRNECVYCDKLRLKQMLLNLISNAIKYTHPGGTISLRVAQRPSAKQGRASFEFRCRDNGIGMDKEFAKTIFDPFTREENSTVSGIQGTGLGMAITKNIVDMMGGSISVSSKRGEGTEFIVRVDFRIAEKKTSDQTAADVQGLSLKGRRVLLVDDYALNLQIGMLQLQAQGMVVDTAGSGQIAIDTIRKNGAAAYDFVLMDVQMPVMDGYEATSIIRKLPGGDKLKIIAYSANAFEEDRKQSLRAGMDGHIAKPLNINDILNELKRFVA